MPHAELLQALHGLCDIGSRHIRQAQHAQDTPVLTDEHGAASRCLQLLNRSQRSLINAVACFLEQLARADQHELSIHAAAHAASR